MSDRDELVAQLRGWDHCWPARWLETAVADAADQIERDGREIEELRRLLGGGCDANAGGCHTVITQGRYRFCGKCGESLTGVRYCHAPRAALNGEASHGA